MSDEYNSLLLLQPSSLRLSKEGDVLLWECLEKNLFDLSFI